MSEATSNLRENELECEYCKLPMPKAAVVCTKCGNHRFKWRNELKYFAGVVGLLTALAAGITYVVTSAPELRKVLDWKESLAILRLSFAHGLVIHNQGDGKVFIRDIAVSAKQFQSDEKLYSLVLTINKPIAAGDTLVHEFEVNNEHKKVLDEYWRILDTDSDEQFAKAVRLSGQVRELKQGTACYEQIIYGVDDPSLRNYQESLGNRLRTYPVTAHVHFFSTRFNRLISQEIEVVGVLTEAPTKRCAAVR